MDRVYKYIREIRNGWKKEDQKKKTGKREE
jgi:hypothetical protein